jgi:raffinose/stachyose/melibiose transport system substrate-binding protein
MRNLKAFLSVLLAAMLFAAACGSDDESSGGDDGSSGGGGEDVTLQVLIHQNPPLVEFMESFNTEFEAANPNISIDLSIVSADDLGVSNQTRLTANDLDVTVITIAGFEKPVQDYMEGAQKPSWQTLIEAGLLMDLTDEPWMQNYDEAARTEGGGFDGRVYSANLGRVSYSGMFVNETLLADIGVAVPTTWDELVAACESVKASGNECMTVGASDGWPTNVGSYGLLGSFYPDQQGLAEGLWTGEIALNDEKTTELYRRHQIYATEMLEDGVTGLAHDAAIVRYAAGDVAFAPTGVWQAPVLDDPETGVEFDWTYIPFPGSDNAADNQILFGKYDMGMAIAADTDHPDEAKAYLAALSEPETYNDFANAVGFLPTQPTATLDSTLGEAVAPLLADFQVGFEQYWVAPTGAGQWANLLEAPSYFAPFNEWDDATELANQAQADLEAGLGS